jgi:hypothetical protein
MPVGPLNDDPLRLDMKLSKLLLWGVGVVVIAGIDSDFHLGVEP